MKIKIRSVILNAVVGFGYDKAVGRMILNFRSIITDKEG